MKDARTPYDELLASAREREQEHIFAYWDRLSEQQKDALLQQIQQIDFDLLHELYQTIAANKKAADLTFEPVQPIPLPRAEAQKQEAQEMAAVGEQILREGKIGAILVAGGQGTRLGFDGPKGIFPIGPVSQKSLFQLHAEKLLAIRRRYETRVPWYIMTSESNHAATVNFFEDHHYFSLPKEDVFFFVQGMMPALNEQGKLIMDRPDHVFMSPDGHGGIFAALKNSGALEDMRNRGIEYLFYFQVDNVLVKICDPVFLGYHIHQQADMSAKVVSKRDPFEKVGVVGRINGKLGVIEYSDMSDDDKLARDEHGNLLYNAGSIAIHVLSRNFIEKICGNDINLPWHIAHKKVPYIDAQGQTIQPARPNGYKFERFIFDALNYAERAVVLEVDRAEEFSPVKNADGDDSPATARRDMTRLFASWLRAADFPLPENVDGMRLEISPLFALDRDEFLNKIEGKLRIPTAFYLE
ncbi:MAG: UDPGP type 1 family protein [candidate division KSB1 bacterium]|nr:UDPGP type 1 family protein [candidate division KSB1 bacterium]